MGIPHQHDGGIIRKGYSAELDELRKFYSDKQIVEIALVISIFGFHNRWNQIMRTPLEEPVLEFREQHPQAFVREGGPTGR